MAAIFVILAAILLGAGCDTPAPAPQRPSCDATTHSYYNVRSGSCSSPQDYDERTRAAAYDTIAHMAQTCNAQTEFEIRVASNVDFSVSQATSAFGTGEIRKVNSGEILFPNLNNLGVDVELITGDPSGAWVNELRDAALGQLSDPELYDASIRDSLPSQFDEGRVFLIRATVEAIPSDVLGWWERNASSLNTIAALHPCVAPSMGPFEVQR